jgi:CBS domain-containing protein
MKNLKVKKLVVPLDEFLVVNKDTSLLEVILSLKEKKEKNANFHSTVFITDDRGKFIGKISILDILRGIEPKYKEVSDVDLSRFGYSEDFVLSILKNYDLWAHPLENLCQNIPNILASEVARDIDTNETVSTEDSLDLAVHKMVMNNYTLLLVEEDGSFVGVLRSIDLFFFICEQVEKCDLK